MNKCCYVQECVFVSARTSISHMSHFSFEFLACAIFQDAHFIDFNDCGREIFSRFFFFSSMLCCVEVRTCGHLLICSFAILFAIKTIRICCCTGRCLFGTCDHKICVFSPIFFFFEKHQINNIDMNVLYFLF